MKATIRKAEFGSLKAFASVEVAPGIVINDFKVLAGRDGKEWVALPSRKDDRKGKVTYYNSANVTQEVRNQISEVVLKAFKG